MAGEKHKFILLREKAEKILHNRGGPDSTIYTRDLETLVQELSIYHIELEQQNEELRRTQVELEKSRRKFSDLFDNAPFSYFLILENYQIVNLNATACRFMGGSKSDFLNQKITRFIHPSSQDTFLFHIREALVTNKSISCDIKLVSRQNEDFYVRLLTKAEKDEENEALSIIRISVSDHTSEVEAENARKASEEKFRQLAENSPVIVYRASLLPTYKFDYVSPAASVITGYTPDEYYADPSLRNKIIHPDDRESYEISIGMGSGEAFVFRWIKKDGTIIWTEQRNVLIRDENNVAFAVEGTVRDITEQKTAENALRESEEKYRTIFEGAPLGIFRSVPEGRFIEVNQALADMFGYETPEEVISSIGNIAEQMYTEAGRREEIIKITSKDKVSKFENAFKRKNGDTFFANLYIREITDLNGFTILEGMIEDITEAKKYEKFLEVAKDKAEESDRLKSSFLQNMSHEIRTPMNAICGFADLLMNEREEEKIQSFTHIIQKSSEQLLSLIDDIILYSKLQTKLIPVNLSGFKVIMLVKDVYESFAYQDMPGRIVLRFEISESCRDLYIKADYEKIRQVLTNLVSNAIKYTIQGEIVIGCSLLTERIEFSVRDTGIGIPASEHKNIFNRFYRGEQVEKTAIRGTGLGLCIVKEMVQLLEGEIEVSSIPGEGSRFYFSIPLLREVPEPPKKVQHVSGDVDINDLSVLIVEDEIYNYMYLRALLGKLVKTIDHAFNGRDAIELVRHNTYDLILMDLKMPVMNGHDATIEIKKMYPDMMVIAQTAYSHQEEKDLALLSGCDGYITKPIIRDDILNVIDQVVSHKRNKQTPL